LEIIERLYQRKKHKFHVYTKSEVDKDPDMGYCYWKDVESTSQWCLTDDDYVMECLSIKEYTDKNGNIKTFIKLSGGVGWDTASSKIHYELNKAYGIYAKTNPAKSWEEQEIGSTRGKNTINAYANMMLNGNVDFKKLANVYRPKDKIPEATVRRFLKNKRIKMEVEKKVKEILTEKSINKEFAVDNLIRALDMAEHKGDVGNFLKANDQIMDLLEMKPNKAITTDTVEMIDTKKILDKITQEEEKKLVMSRKEETNERNE
tara:strand:- start:18 stop:800 length:783 start_codon:yes stop_codon:yes gene_type:complete